MKYKFKELQVARFAFTSSSSSSSSSLVFCVHRSWYSPQRLPLKARDRGPVLALMLYFLGDSFFLGCHLVLLQVTITIAFYDLHRCSWSILSSPISQGNNAFTMFS